MANLSLITVLITISSLITPFITSETLSINITAISNDLFTDPLSLSKASRDYGNITSKNPKAVHCPESPDDVASLVRTLFLLENNDGAPSLQLAARGQGHSLRGQAMVEDGVVVNMTCLAASSAGISFSDEGYADVSGGSLWVDVLREGLKIGVSPVTWTDYLYLSVGGTLSNAGIGGQTFRHGPQISNVLELDVVTGNGEKVTCSASKSPQLFYGVLGGLGQFGIITRARIPVDSSPRRVKWVRLLYSDFQAFTRDRERLISMADVHAADFVEGQVLLSNGVVDTSFYPVPDQSRVRSLVKLHTVIYVLEIAKYYDDPTLPIADKVLELLSKILGFVPGFMFVQDVTYFDFLNRAREEEEKLRAVGQYLEVPHPWLNLFVPRSRVSDFNDAVFKNVLLSQNFTAGVMLFYPTNRNKWDDRMSAAIPDEEVFYVVGLLLSGAPGKWQQLDHVNQQIIAFCDNAGIKIKQYLTHYSTQEEWIKHFGPKWNEFQQRKILFDPKRLLSPGQEIFN